MAFCRLSIDVRESWGPRLGGDYQTRRENDRSGGVVLRFLMVDLQRPCNGLTCPNREPQCHNGLITICVRSIFREFLKVGKKRASSTGPPPELPLPPTPLPPRMPTNVVDRMLIAIKAKGGIFYQVPPPGPAMPRHGTFVDLPHHDGPCTVSGALLRTLIGSASEADTEAVEGRKLVWRVIRAVEVNSTRGEAEVKVKVKVVRKVQGKCLALRKVRRIQLDTAGYSGCGVGLDLLPTTAYGYSGNQQKHARPPRPISWCGRPA